MATDTERSLPWEASTPEVSLEGEIPSAREEDGGRSAGEMVRGLGLVLATFCVVTFALEVGIMSITLVSNTAYEVTYRWLPVLFVIALVIFAIGVAMGRAKRSG